MIYLISFITFLIGARGILILIYRSQRIKQVAKLINFTEETNKSKTSGDNAGSNESQLNKTIKKNSKLVSISSELDKNIKAKIVLFLMLITPILFIKYFDFWVLTNQVLIVILFVIFAFVIIVPARVEAAIMERRFRKISNDVPYVIDLLAVCVQSGMTVEAALSYIAYKIEMINKDLSSLLIRTVMRSDVSGINSALEQLSAEVKTEEVRMLCTTLMQSTKFGSSIYSVLIDLAKEMRLLNLLSMEENVAALSGKMTLPMIALILFPLIAIVAGPGLIKMSLP